MSLSRDHKTTFDIAEGLAHSEQTSDIKKILARYGAVRANELNQPRDELRKTVTEMSMESLKSYESFIEQESTTPSIQ